MRLSRYLLILLLFVQCIKLESQESVVSQDSIQELINRTDDLSYSTDQRLQYGLSSVALAQAQQNDSLELRAQSKLMNVYFDKQDFKAYIETNQNIVKLSTRLRDSLRLGQAYFALGFAYNMERIIDSAYYYYSKSAKIFDSTNNKEQLSSSLNGLSVIQLDGKDYFGAEENAVRALRAIENSKETEDVLVQKCLLNTLLGSIAHSLRNYDKAIEFYNNTLELTKKMDNGLDYKLDALNNMAFTKRVQGRYEESKVMFQELLLTENLFNDDPSFYALILENFAYSKYLTGNFEKENIISLFEESYAICNSIGDDFVKAGTVISWAKFSQGVGDLNLAIQQAKEAYQLSKSAESNEVLLESMLLLSELVSGSEGKTYLKEHIQLSDSLLQVERNVRNKFARIELETDRLEAENEQISRENLYLIILSVGLLLTAILIYVVISQRAKNRKLKLIQVQQKANEDIYNLMLQQQDKVEEARTLEKKRISEELHDGVLGRLFGTRLSLDSINFKSDKEAILTRANYIGQLKTIEEDIRKISHELNTDFVSGSGFMDIVSELIENQTTAYGLTYDFNYTDDINWDNVPNKTKINMYRIVQESMQNIYKHANAKHIKISFSLENNVICLGIADDGQGFDTSRGKKGIGLKNMSSRVEDVGGSITFSSTVSKGTTVNVQIPYLHQSV